MLTGGGNLANAYTVSDLTSAGWTQVTDISAVTLSDHYFIFVDGQEGKYTMANNMPKGILTSVARPTYQELADPASDICQVWTIENYDAENYAIKSISDNFFLNSNGQWWSSHVSSDYSTTSRLQLLTLSEGKYLLQTTGTSTYWGPYNDNPTVALGNASGMDFESGASDTRYAAIAANKSEANAPGFYVYAIARTTFDDNCRRASKLISEGWTQVTTMEGLGKSGYYYAFLDASENGGESGFAMTGTGGRPKYKLGKDPIADNTQLWITEAHGSGYAIKNVSDGKYIYAAASWNMQATDNISTNNTDFIPAVNDGVWTLSNSISTGEFVGNYKNSPYNPTDGEDLAANKASKKGKRTFLIYSIPTIAGVAEALPVSGDMVADTWYYIDIPATAGNYTATATDLSKIVYSANAGTTVVPRIATSTFTAENNSLAAQRYYVKSSTANNLVIGVSSYTYTVGTPTPSIADGAYIASLSTISFTFSDAGTTDPEASFALLNGSAKAVLTKGGANVAEGTLSLSGKVLTATFSDVALDLSSTYNITIAAGVVGYDGEETSAAINTSFRTGIIADGVYYFKKKGEYKYLTRGGNYGTETVVDNYGISLQAIIQADGTYYLKNVDHSLSANTDKFLNMYTDQGAYAWTIAAATGGYYLKYTDGKYMKTNYVDYTDNNSNTNRYYYQAGTETEGEAIVWELLSKAEYATSLTAKKNAEIAAIATAAGIDASTLTAFESALAADYGTTDMTSNINNPLCNSASGWTAVSYNGGSTYTAIDYHAPTIQIYNRPGGITQTINGLTNGIYKVTVSATWRPGNSVAATRAGNEANTTAWIYANDNITQMKGWYEGGGTINSTQDLIDNAASYLNTVYAYVSDGTMKIGVAVPSFCEQNWCPIYNWTLTYYEAKATPAEKTALANAIAAAEAKNLGFEDEEYAPYNNVDAIVALAAAKAIVPETASGAAVVAATTALTTATSAMVANDGEVNAICWDYSTLATTEKSKAYGWYDPALGENAEGSMYSTRVFNHVGSNAGLAAVNNNVALFTKISTNYGKVEGYTLPLKANRTYKLAFKYAGWTEPSESTISITDENGENPLAISGVVTVSGTAQNGNSSTEAWANYEGYFAVPADGNYILNINRINMGGNVQRQLVMGNIDLRTASALEFADDTVPTYAPGTYPTVKITRSLTANRWATAVYPFAVSGVDNIAVLDSYDKETGALGFTSAAASVANEPFLMRSTSDKTEITLSNVGVAATAASPAITKSEASLKGAYTATDITNTEKNYVLSNNKIYSVGAAGATINPYRAYIQIDQNVGGDARALSFFIDGDETTGIEGINAETKAIEGTVYNLQGQRVEKAQKGLFIKNGKKVVIK